MRLDRTSNQPRTSGLHPNEALPSSSQQYHRPARSIALYAAGLDTVREGDHLRCLAQTKKGLARREASVDCLMLLLAAALRLAAALSGLEARAARAALHRVRVEDGEAGLHQVVDVVDLGALHERRALRVDEHRDAALLDDDVVFLAALGDRHAVLVARAAAADDEYAQRSVFDPAVLEQGARLLSGLVGDRYDADGFLDHAGPPISTASKHRRDLYSLALVYRPADGLTIDSLRILTRIPANRIPIWHQ